MFYKYFHKYILLFFKRSEYQIFLISAKKRRNFSNKFVPLIFLIFSIFLLRFTFQNQLAFQANLCFLAITSYFLFTYRFYYYPFLIILITVYKIFYMRDYMGLYGLGDSAAYMQKIYDYADQKAFFFEEFQFLHYIVNTVSYFYYLVSLLLGNINERNFVLFNQLLICLGCLFWLKVFKYDKGSSLGIVLLAFSEESFFYSSWVAKESIMFFIVSVLTYMFVYRKNFLIFAFLLLVGSLMRPYFITILISVLIFFGTFRRKTLYFLFFISILFSLIYIYQHVGLSLDHLFYLCRNSFHAFAGLLLSPNWTRIVNWSNYFFMTLHSLFFFVFLIYFTFFSKNQLKFYFRMFVLLCLFMGIVIGLFVTTETISSGQTDLVAFHTTRLLFPFLSLKYVLTGLSLFHFYQIINYLNKSSDLTRLMHYSSK